MANTSTSLTNRGYLQTENARQFFGVSDSTLRDRARAGVLDRQYDENGRAYYRVYFNSTEMAQRLNVSRSTVRRMAERNELTSQNINGHTYYTNFS